MLDARPNYFAGTAVFMSEAQRKSMMDQISAIEFLAKNTAYQKEMARRLDDPIFDQQGRTRGAFMGYDFHMTNDGAKLIEVNTNAGGALIVNAMSKALGRPSQRAENMIVDMFKREWKMAGRTGPLTRIAIIDHEPETQFHYPDMCLAKEMFERAGIETIIADVADLVLRDNKLWIADKSIDLVYNRTTDFMLSAPGNSVLRTALMDDLAVVTPAPRHHALYADKRNLTIFSDTDRLMAYGMPGSVQETLASIPFTGEVTSDNYAGLWASRKDYFFKPKDGFGSRAAYRGAKITKKVWDHIGLGNYVAQDFIPAPKRAVNIGRETLQLKYDIRVYTYNGDPILMMARIYEGQTTNLRTDGGGLAVVLPLGAFS